MDSLLTLMHSKDLPGTLQSLCLDYVTHNIEVLCDIDHCTGNFELKKGVTLPREICEEILETYQRNGYTVDDKFLHMFQDVVNTRVKRICLRNSTLTHTGLAILLEHKLEELDLINCPHVTSDSIEHVNETSENLCSLRLMGSHIIPETLYESEADYEMCSKYCERSYILNAPNLRRLVAWNMYIPDSQSSLYFSLLLQPLQKLTHLDLTGCGIVGNLSVLCEMQNLLSLILHNVNVHSVLSSVCQVKSLRHLDISQINDKQGTFDLPNETLEMLVENLPVLNSLDISGTNLAGRGVARPSFKTNSIGMIIPQPDIPGLTSRVENPLTFLGLYGTHYGACRRHDIPAERIAGDANEEQLFYAAKANIDRPNLLQKILNDMYHLFRYESCRNMDRSVNIVTDIMCRHLKEKQVQISGSATLFYILKGRERNSVAIKMKRLVISTLLNAMQTYQVDDTLNRNCCLTLCQFKIPDDVLFAYERLVVLLLHIVGLPDQDSFVQRITIYLLNSLACQVDRTQKQLLGDRGAIQCMLELIENRINSKICDDVLEIAWSTMWNVTDETPRNCERFLGGRGMEFFLTCLKVFPDKEELLRNMMGLLGNVAEVKYLRPQLMTKEFVVVFSDLLDSHSDGIEISYNSAGVLSHMASDGVEAWTVSVPKRDLVLRRMVNAIDSWDIKAERNINYRSFEPILQLAGTYHTPECQHWAVWALANLTEVYPEKYCKVVEMEGGLELLKNIIHSKSPYPRIKELAKMVINNCHKYKELESDELDG